MTSNADVPRVASATLEIAADSKRIFELIADPSLQPQWDGNDNLAWATSGQRVRAVGEVFTMTLTRGGIRENHVVEFRRGAAHCVETRGAGSTAPRSPLAMGT